MNDAADNASGNASGSDLEQTPDDAQYDDLMALAEDAGIATSWQDYRGVMHTVSAETLRAVLAALELPCIAATEIAASRMHLAAENQGDGTSALPPLYTGMVGAPLALPVGARFAGCAWRIVFEDRSTRDGRFSTEGPALIEAIDRFGYHRLQIDEAHVDIILAISPTRCYGVADALAAAGRDREERPWGLAAQLYGLVRKGDGGLGDYASLAILAQHAARQGADALAISPVHAMFGADLDRYSPYGPSSRLLLNALHVDPQSVFDAKHVATALDGVDLSEGAQLEANKLIDWPASSAWRLALLHRLFDLFLDHDDRSLQSLRAEFAAFRRAGGKTLEDHTRFEALHAMLAADDATMRGGWRAWPAAYRDPRAAAVSEFAATHERQVAFHAFLQWQAARQLDAAQRAAREAGMAIGIIADLAVGADGSGSQAWSRQRDMLIGLSIGAPPDLLNALGQSWGLTAFSPRALRATGFEAWIAMLRAAFAHAGGVRIDHILGLARMWLVPDGAHAIEGAYLRYPIDDLLRLVALESWRYRAIVIGEDLGTVPEGLPERLAGAGLLGIRVLWFERDWTAPGQPFRSPLHWSDRALAVTTTHDLPTTAGWWRSRDIDWRVELDLFGEHSSEVIERAAREADRHALWHTLGAAGLAFGDAPGPDAPPLCEALAAIGATPAPLAIVPIDDALGVVEQPNLPGTITTHPNWRRRLPDSVERMLDNDEVKQRLAALAVARATRR